MMTAVGVTFSMILVVLALPSSQYTSRILRHFRRSRTTQDRARIERRLMQVREALESELAVRAGRGMGRA